MNTVQKVRKKSKSKSKSKSKKNRPKTVVLHNRRSEGRKKTKISRSKKKNNVRTSGTAKCEAPAVTRKAKRPSRTRISQGFFKDSVHSRNRRIQSKSKIRAKKKNILRKKSNSKLTWEKFLKNKDSRKALQRSWSSKNPQKYYKSTIVRLAKKYSKQK